MEKYVIPLIFDLDFKFPASLLLLQQQRRVQKSQPLCQPAVARAVQTVKYVTTDGRQPAGTPRRAAPHRTGCSEY